MNHVTIEYDTRGQREESYDPIEGVVPGRSKIIISGASDDLKVFSVIIGAVGELVMRHNKEIEALAELAGKYEKELAKLRECRRPHRQQKSGNARKIASLRKRLANAQKKLAAIHDRRLLTKGSERVRMNLFNRYVNQRDLVESLQAEIAKLESSEKS